MRSDTTISRALSPTARRAAMLAVLCGACLGALEATVVGSAMPLIVAELGGLDVYGWVFAAYVIASTAAMPIFGKLADVHGRRPVFLGGMAAFLLGSALAGQARSMTWLIAARVLQGLGAGAIQPVGMTVAGDLYGPERRGRAQALFSSVWAVTSMLGPWLGALLLRGASWRAAFYVTLPFGLASALILARVLRDLPRATQRRSIDWVGAVTLAAGVAALLAIPRALLSPRAGTLVPALAAAVALLGLAFLRAQRRAAEPILSPAVLRDPMIGAVAWTSFFSGAALLGASTFVPLYVLGALGAGVSGIGAALMPISLGWAVGANLAGRLVPRLGPRPLAIAGSVLSAAAALAMPLGFGEETAPLVVSVVMGLFGLGFGTCSTAMLVGVQGAVPPKDRAASTAATAFYRSIGGAVGVTAMTALLGVLLPSFDDAQRLLDPAHREALSGGGAVGALSNVLALVAVFAVAAAVCALRLPSRRVAEIGRRASGLARSGTGW